MLSTKKLFLIQSFVSNALVIYPLYAIMFTERGGLSTGEVSVLFAIWTVAALIFEVPTGLIADKYPRKYVLISGELINAAAFVVWLFTPTFLGYATGFILWGAAYALKSGTYQALVYDELASTGQNQTYTKMMSRIKAAEFSGMLVAFIAAYVLSVNGVNYTLLLIASTVTVAVSAGLLGLLPNVKNHSTDLVLESQPKLLRRAVTSVRNNQRVRIVTAWLAIVAGFIGWYEEYTPLFDSTAGIPTKYIPLVVSVALVVNILASLAAPRFESDGRIAKALLIVSAGLMVIFSTLGWWLLLIVVLAHGGLVLLRVLRILLDAELQHVADSSMRATLGSIASLLSYPVTITVALGFASLTTYTATFVPFRWVGVAIIVCGIILLLHTPKAIKNT